MKRSNLYRTLKPAALFLGKVLLFYIILDWLFWVYVGLSDSRGSYYFPILDHVNIVSIVLSIMLYPVQYVLELAGYHPYITFLPGMCAFFGIPTLFKLHVAFPCLGFKIMIAFTSLMLAYPGQKKWLFIPVGLFFIQCINILRVGGIVASLLYYPSNVSLRELAESSHTFFNYGSYAFIIFFFYWWVSRYSKNKKA